MSITDPFNVRCRTCQEWLIPREIIDEAEAVHGDAAQDEILRYLWDQEPAFRQMMERVQAGYKNVQRARQAAVRSLKVTSAGIATDLADQIAAVRARVAAAKTAYKASAERKGVVNAESAYSRNVTMLRQRWGASIWQMRRAFRNTPDAFRLIPDRFLTRRSRVEASALNVIIQ